MSHNTAKTQNTPPATESAACAVAAPAAPAPGACAFDLERRLMSAAAAHAYEMQSGGDA